MNTPHITELGQIQLTADDLSPFDAHLATATESYSPTAPRKPVCTLGWRERWWLHNSAGQQVVINYWVFASSEDAQTAADEGRIWLSTRTVWVRGRRESIYQLSEATERLKGAKAWQADHNFLFVKENVLVLVAEFGKQVPQETTLAIATKILEKIEANPES